MKVAQEQRWGVSRISTKQKEQHRTDPQDKKFVPGIGGRVGLACGQTFGIKHSTVLKVEKTVIQWRLLPFDHLGY